MITITLKGELGDLFIPEFEADCNSAASVISCLKANFPEIVDYFIESAERGIGFIIRAGKQELEEAQLGLPISKHVKSFVITPVPRGSGGGLGRILLGVVILGVGLLSGGAGFLGLSSSTLMLTGGAMILSGIMSMFGQVKSPDKNDKKSMIFNGSQNTVTAGEPVPIVYGLHLTGMQVLSARVYSYAT
jgi:predicted phage tail protein